MFTRSTSVIYEQKVPRVWAEVPLIKRRRAGPAVALYIGQQGDFAMTRILFALLVMMSFQFTYAADTTPDNSQTNTEQPSQKSFFETRSLQDFQKMVNADVQFSKEMSADLASAQLPGNG